MQTKTLEALLIEANDLVKRLSYDESVDLINNTQTVIIDVREESEVYNLGVIKNAIHIPRGLIEFQLSAESTTNPLNIKKDSDILIYCAAGIRAALAAKTLQDLGFENVFNLGGLSEWVSSGGAIEP